MAYETKPGEVALFYNDKFVQGGNQPQWKGKGVDLSGNEIQIALWPKVSKNGVEYYSGRLSPKWEGGSGGGGTNRIGADASHFTSN